MNKNKVRFMNGQNVYHKPQEESWFTTVLGAFLLVGSIAVVFALLILII